MVIVTLNLGPQGPNQLKVWGHYSEQIHDYVERGLMEKVATPTGTRLWKMVDPYSYRDRLAMPKLLINGTNDRYWTLDALDLYWGGLKGPKYLIELPNAGHGLDKNRDWAINGLAAFFRQVATGRPLPRLSWTFDADKDGEAILKVQADPAPRRPTLDGPLGLARLPRVDLDLRTAGTRPDAHCDPAPPRRRPPRAPGRARVRG